MKTSPVIARRYEVQRRLGRGAWGEVFLVEDLLEPGRQLALKTRRLDAHGTGDSRVTLATEFRLLTRLRHPNLARVYDLGLTREPGAGLSQIYFTRQFVDGVDLVTALREAPEDKAFEVAAVLCHALATIHDHGIIHGDLSAANVLGPASGRAADFRIIDFGLAVTLSGESSQISGLRGTLHYVAPDVLRGAHLSARTDLYALGALLHHALVGEPPFQGSPAAVIQQHLDVPPPPLERLRPDLRPELVAVVRRLMAKDPAHRYATAWDALRDLEGTAGPGGRPAVEAPLLGRDAALASLERTLRALPAEQRVLAVVGEDSSGRTRFLEALRWRIELGGRAEVTELGFSAAAADPLDGVRRLVARAALLAGSDPGEDVAAALRAEGGAADPSRAWPAVAGFVVDALKAAPAVLLVDDLHLAPEPAFDLLTHVVRLLDETPEAPPLVVASRPGDRVDALLAETEQAERVTLAELDEADTDRMVAALAGGPRPDLARAVRAHAGGLPGYVEEVTRALLERGDDVDAEVLPVPTGLEAAVRERLSRLGPRERVILDLAAVVDGLLVWDGGREEEGEALRGMAHKDFLAIARSLCAAGLLEERYEERFGFPRSAVRNAVYSASPMRARRRLHAAQLGRLWPLGAAMPTGERLVAAARHALRSQPRDEAAERALRLALGAASFLRAKGAPAEAARLLGPALALARGPALREVRLALADALATTGEYGEAVALLKAAADDAEGPARAEAWALAGAVLERQGDYDGASALLARALEGGIEGEPRAEALMALASISLARGAYDEAARAARDALAAGPSEALRPRVMSTLGTAASYRGDHATAIATLEAARDLARRAGGDEGSTEALVAGHLAIAYGRAGRARDSAAAYREAAELAERSGDLGRLPAHLMNLGVAHHGLGDFAQALELYRRAARLARRMGKQSVVVAALVNLADLSAHLGAADEGRTTATRALVLARRRGMAAFEARALQALAECAALQSPASGVGDAERAAERFEALGLTSNAIEARLVGAELMLWAGEPKRAAEAAQSALAQAQPLGEPTLLARARLVLTEARVARGETSGCREILKELVADDGAPELPAEIRWRAFATLGALLAQQGETARAERCDTAAVEILEASLGRVPPEHREALSRHPARRALRRAQPGTAAKVTEDRVFRLMEVNRAVLAERDPRRLLALALDTAVELCGAERGFLITLGPRGTVKVEVARNLDREAVRSAQLKVSRSIAEEVARKGEPLLTVNAREDERFAHFASVQDLRLRSVMCVPIRGREATLGTLYLDNRFESARFGEADLKLLLAFADVVAVALENARLIEENSRKAEELEKSKSLVEAAKEQQALQLKSALRELEATREALGLKYDYSQIIGRSSGMLRVFQVLDRIIDTHVPVLIQGDSGTGKELIARAIHYNGARKHGPFVSVNCGAIPESLLESELFGHVKGAFTGATADREGLLPAAHRGSLFLDEIGDMSLGMQTKLLRVLQTGEVRPVGANVDRIVDVRFVAASHRDLAEEVAAGRFREDLFYRVNVVRIHLPPLRERREDIPLLAEQLLERCAGELGGVRKRLAPDAIDALLRHDWPGNVRELENLLKNAAVLSSGPEIHAADIPLTTRRGRLSETPPPETLNLAALERQTIQRALQAAGGNKKRAAELLGIARLTLYRKLKEEE